MNPTRVATLLRELADALEEEPVDELAESGPRRRRPRDLSFPPPTGPVSDVDRARARKMLRRRGIHT